MGGMAIDFTDRVQAVEALQRSEALYRTLVQSLPDSAVLLFDRELRFLVVEGESLTKHGFPQGEVEGKTLWEVMSSQSAEELEPYYRAALAGLKHSFETDYAGRSFLVQAVPVKDDQGQIFAGMLLSLDITSLKDAERLVAAEKEQLAVTLRSIGDGVITTDLTGRVTLLNRVAEKMTGWKQEAAKGQPLSVIFQVIDELTRQVLPNPVEAALASGTVVELPNHALLVARDGTERHIADSAAPIRDRDSQILGAVLVFRDVTDQQRLEAEMLKSSQLEALGVLAGGIAHDFNNLLTGLMGNVSLARYLVATTGDLAQNAEITSCLEEAEKAARRSKKLAQQLLTFARGGAPQKQVLQLGTVIQEAAELALRGSLVEGVFQFPGNLWPVEADAGQIGQVIQNLVLNAVQAMPQGGRIAIKAENLRLRQGTLTGLNGGKYLKVSVHDSGSGILPEVLLKIFDPYFTTKPEGNGLGLAVSYSIMKKYAGLITVASMLGEGTTFELYLPASIGSLRPGLGSLGTGPLRAGSVQRGQGRVLVMDDEAVIRSVVVRQLNTLGYAAEAVGDGRAALAHYQAKLRAGQPYAVVILDLTIPGGMGGKETVTKLRELDPGVTVVVSSGYANDPIMADYREYGFAGVLVKPYRLEELSDMLTRLLGQVE
jgi:PAS domain S-box-containing protein